MANEIGPFGTFPFEEVRSDDPGEWRLSVSGDPSTNRTGLLFFVSQLGRGLWLLDAEEMGPGA